VCINAGRANASGDPGTEAVLFVEMEQATGPAQESNLREE
jgi:hypothetical protein